MAKLADILNANASIPRALETKFSFLPKISGQLATMASKVPTGPEIPAVVVTVLEPPPPNKAGQPLASFFSSKPIGGVVSLPGSASLPLSPPNPGASRGSIEYAGLPLSPTTPGASRGTILYGE